MPFSQQYAFVFTDKFNTDARFAKTCGHELGHGIFALEHPFKFHAGIDTFAYENLMSYHPTSVKLLKYQWDRVQNPLDRGYYEAGDEGQVEEFSFEELLTDEFDLTISSMGTRTYLTPAGKPLKIIGAHTAEFSSKFPENISKGALVRFRSNGTTYIARYRGNKKNNIITLTEFLGYANSLKKDEFYESDNYKPENFPVENVWLYYKNENEESEQVQFTLSAPFSLTPDKTPYRGAGKIIDFPVEISNGIVNVKNIGPITFPELSDENVDDIIPAIFATNPALAFLCLDAYIASKNNPNKTIAVGLNANGSVVFVGEASAGLAFHNGEIRSFASIGGGINFVDAITLFFSKNTGGTASLTVRITVINGGFDIFNGQALSAGVGVNVGYFAGGVSSIWRWPSKYSFTILDYLLHPGQYSVDFNELPYIGFCVDVGIGFGKGISLTGQGGNTWVFDSDLMEQISNYSNELYQDLKVEDAGNFNFVDDNLGDEYYLVQLAANSTHEGGIADLQTIYEDGSFLEIYDDCENLYKYFYPQRFKNLNYAKIEAIRLNEVATQYPSFRIPMLIKYNQVLNKIVEKRSATSFFDNVFYNYHESVTIDKLSYDFGNIPLNSPVEVEFIITNSPCGNAFIENVYSLTGDVSGEFSTEPFPPEGNENKRTVKVIYTKNYKPGFFDKTVKIETNKKVFNVRITGTITH